MQSLKNNLGYTLTELLVGLVIMSLLIGVLMPSYTGFKARRAIGIKAWDIKRSLELARSIAVTQHIQTKVCTTDADFHCVKSHGSRLLVFVDDDKDHRWTVGEPIYRDTEIGDFDIALSASQRAYIRFKGSGESMESGNFLICSEHAGDFGRQVIVFRTGRIRLSKDSNKDGYDDRSGRKIRCEYSVS